MTHTKNMLERINYDIDHAEQAISNLQGKLQWYADRQQARTTKRAELAQMRLEATEAKEQASTVAGLARCTESELSAKKAYDSAFIAYEAVERQCRDEESICAAEERGDQDMLSKIQSKLNGERQALTILLKHHARLLLARDEAHEQAGRERFQMLRMAYTSLQDQQDGLEQSLEYCESERANLAGVASERLSEYPELLAAILREHVPYEDEVTALISGLLQWRAVVLNEDTIRIAETNAIPLAWLQVDPSKEPVQWRAGNTADIEKWLEQYKERH